MFDSWPVSKPERKTKFLLNKMCSIFANVTLFNVFFRCPCRNRYFLPQLTLSSVFTRVPRSDYMQCLWMTSLWGCNRLPRGVEPSRLSFCTHQGLPGWGGVEGGYAPSVVHKRLVMLSVRWNAVYLCGLETGDKFKKCLNVSFEYQVSTFRCVQFYAFVYDN